MSTPVQHARQITLSRLVVLVPITAYSRTCHPASSTLIFTLRALTLAEQCGSLGHSVSSHTLTVWDIGPWHCYCRTLQCLSVQVLAKIEGMGMKSRFVELRENRQREERERREKLVSCALLG